MWHCALHQTFTCLGMKTTMIVLCNQCKSLPVIEVTCDWVGSTNITAVCGWTIFLKESGRFTVIFIIHNTNKCNFPSSFGVTQNTRLYCFTLQAMSLLAWFLVRLSIPDCPPVLVCTYSGFKNRDQFWAPQIQNMWRTRWGPKRADS